MAAISLPSHNFVPMESVRYLPGVNREITFLVIEYIDIYEMYKSMPRGESVSVTDACILESTLVSIVRSVFQYTLLHSQESKIQRFVPSSFRELPREIPEEETRMVFRNTVQDYFSLDLYGMSTGAVFEMEDVEGDAGSYALIRKHSMATYDNHILYLERTAQKPIAFFGRFQAQKFLYRALLEMHRRYPTLPFHEISAVETELGTGAQAEVKEITINGKKKAIKLFKNANDRVYENAHQVMYQTFKAIAAEAAIYLEIPRHNSLASFEGLGYVTSLNRWGMIFEKIEGQTLATWSLCPDEGATCIQLFLDFVDGLKWLGRQGWPCDDTHFNNLMIRLPEKRGVVIDYVTPPGRISYVETPLKSRRLLAYAFCVLLRRAQMSDISTGLPREFSTLVAECNSNTSMETLGWDQIQKSLSAMQRRLKA